MLSLSSQIYWNVPLKFKARLKPSSAPSCTLPSKWTQHVQGRNRLDFLVDNHQPILPLRMQLI